MKNKRIIDWIAASNLTELEIKDVIECGKEIMKVIKESKLSQYQAKQALKFVTVCLDEEKV